MKHPTLAGVGLVRLGDSDFVPASPADDLRGKDVLDPYGQRMGRVEDLYIAPREREVRYLELGTGGFLGIGERRFLVPVEAVAEVAEDQVIVEPDRTKRADGPVPFDNKVRLPSAEDRKNDDDAWPPFGNAEGTVDPRGGYHSSFPAGRRRFL